MFRDILRTTPLTTDTANSVFNGKIDGELIHGDATFLATLRALVSPRMKDGESLYFKHHHTNYTARQFNNSQIGTKRDTLRDFADSERGTICIHEFNSYTDEDNKVWMDFADEDFCAANPGFAKLEKVTAFFRKSFGVSCFINVETRCVQLFTTRLDAARIHYLQCGIFAYLPWYFDPKEGVSELEMELISSLREKSSAPYLDVMSRIASQYDFRTKKIEMKLRGFETAVEKRELADVESSIASLNREINSHNRVISDKLRELNSMQIRHLGLQEKIKYGSEESEIMDYFMCSKSVDLIDVSGTQISFGVRQYLTFFDEDLALGAIKNKRSYVYGYSGVLSQDQVVRLMRAIFIEGDVKLKVCAAFSFDIFGPVNPIEHYEFDHDYSGYTPNTHVDKYGCMGNYRTAINDLLRDHKYIEAIEQCIASCKSLNFTDGIVMGTFMADLCNDFDGVPCIELPDGTCLTPLKAAEYLKEQEEKENGEGN